MQPPASSSATSSQHEGVPPAVAAVADEAVLLVAKWVDAADSAPSGPASRRLRATLADPAGRAFAVAFVDGVVRPPDVRAAAREFERLSRDLPAVMPGWVRILFQLVAGFAVLVPGLLVPFTRWCFARTIRRLIVVTGERALPRQLAALRGAGDRPDLVPVAAPAVDAADAGERRAQAVRLLGRPEVDAISFCVADVAGPSHLWAYDESVDRTIDRILPVLEAAAAPERPKRVTLEVPSFRELGHTLDVFTRMLERSELQRADVGIELAWTVPEAFPTLRRLVEWARERRAGGGERIRVLLSDGIDRTTERDRADLMGWPLPVLPDVEAEANLLRMLEWALSSEVTDAVAIAVSGGSLFDVACAQLLAEQRGVTDGFEVVIPAGLAPGLAEAMSVDIDQVSLRVPAVPPGAISDAARHLIRVLRAAGDHGWMAPETANDTKFGRQEERFRRAVQMAASGAPAPAAPERDLTARPTRTDPSSLAGRARARQLLDRARTSTLGNELVERATVDSLDTLERVIADAAEAGNQWRLRERAERASALEELALVLTAMRGRLTEVLVSESRLPFTDADTQVTDALRHARTIPRHAALVETVENATLEPVPVVLVAPSHTATVLDTVEGVCSTLAAGSAVLLQPTVAARRAAALIADAAREAGLPDSLVTLLVPGDAEVARAAVTHPTVGRVTFTGDRETARLLRSWRPERPPLGDAPGISSMIVTQSADPDQAAADVVTGAFAGGAQHPRGSRLVILVGAGAGTAAFKERLVAAVRAVPVGPAHAVATRLGPLAARPSDRVRRALTLLEEGESWLVEPDSLDDQLTVWRPGVRDGVDPRRVTERTVPAPAITLTTVADLDEAVALQAALRGLAAGIHSREPAEIEAWASAAEASFLAINRPTFGAPVDGIPCGGALGSGGMPGTPERMLHLARFAPVFAEPEQSVRLDGIGDRVRAFIEAVQPTMSFADFDLVRAGARSDEVAWHARYGAAIPLGGARAQHNALRYRPVPTTVRLAESASIAELIRVLAAAVRVDAPVHVSSTAPLPDRLVEHFGDPLGGIAGGLATVESVLVEPDARWHARVQSGEVATPHIRLLGGDRGILATALVLRPELALFADPVTTSGHLELLPFLRAQVVSATAHRHGTLDPVIAAAGL